MEIDKSYGFLVIEYVPRSMRSDRAAEARIDGHWYGISGAEDVAEYFAEKPMFGGKSRIVVAKIVAEMKNPDGWGD